MIAVIKVSAVMQLPDVAGNRKMFCWFLFLLSQVLSQCWSFPLTECFSDKWSDTVLRWLQWSNPSVVLFAATTTCANKPWQGHMHIAWNLARWILLIYNLWFVQMVCSAEPSKKGGLRKMFRKGRFHHFTLGSTPLYLFCKKPSLTQNL